MAKKHAVLWLLALFMATSCASFKNTKRLAKEDVDHERISRASLIYEAGEIDAAISSLRTLVDETVYRPSHDRAYELIVAWLLQLNRYDEAKRIASYFFAHHQESKSVNKIIALFDDALRNKNQAESVDESMPVREEIDVQNDVDKDGTQELIDLETSVSGATTSKQRQEQFEALARYILFEAPPSVAESRARRNPDHISYGLAHTRRALNFYHVGNFTDAYESIKKALNAQLPDKHIATVTTIKNDIEAITNVNFKSIGFILPLSGSYAPFGKNALTAISIAYGMPMDMAGNNITSFVKDGITIVVADSKSDATRAGVMVDELVKKHHVALIVGEMTNEASLLAAQKCEQYHVPMLSLSRHPLIADVGDFIFVMNASSQQQVIHLVDYAMNTKGHKKFAILFPRHNYGMSLSKMFFDEVIKRGGVIAGLEAYDAHETNFFEPVKKLVGKYYLSLRDDSTACTNLTHKKVVEECIKNLKPLVDFDALFIPEFDKLAFIIPALIEENMLVSNDPKIKQALLVATKNDDPKPIQLLGTNSWNEPATLKKIAHHIDGAYFVDSISFSEGELKDFAKEFATMNTSVATPIDVYAHDAAKLAFAILRKHDYTTRDDIKNQLRNFNEKIGLLPSLSFLKNGELNAPGMGFEIKDGTVATVMQNRH